MQRGHAEVVKALLRAGADVHKPTPHGNTPLALTTKVGASRGKFFAFDGSPTLHYPGVMQGGHAGVFSMLIEAGANPAQLTSDGSTLLALAVEVSTLPVIVMFDAKGSPTTL